jgi:hypothetical protein
MTNNDWLSGQAAKCKSFGVHSCSELANITKAETVYLVCDLILMAALGILVGQWGIGKTPFAMQLAIAVSAGWNKFLGRYSTLPEPVPTLYVDYENGPLRMSETAEKIAKFLGLSSIPTFFRVYNPGFFRRPPQYQKLSEIDFLCLLVKECGFLFVIVDPLRMLDPQAEDKNMNAAMTIRKLRQLVTETGVTILLIHHPKKPDPNDKSSLVDDPMRWMERASGASSLVQNVDFRIGFDKNIDGDLEMRTFVRSKGWGPLFNLVRESDSVTGEPIGYRLEYGIDKLPLGDRKAFDKLNQSFATKDARTELRLSANPTNERLEQWEYLGIIRRVGRGQWEKVPPEGGEQAEQRPEAQSNQSNTCSDPAEQCSGTVNNVNCSVCSAPEGVVQEVVNK